MLIIENWLVVIPRDTMTSSPGSSKLESRLKMSELIDKILATTGDT